MKDPLEIECIQCGAQAGQRCSEPVFGVYEHTFHNTRIHDAGMTLQEHLRQVVEAIPVPVRRVPRI